MSIRPSDPAGAEPGAGDGDLVYDEADVAGIADDIAAYLQGRLADHLADRGRPVPGWAAANRLAHAGLGEVTRLVAGAGAEPPPAHDWSEGERALAAHVLAATGASPDGLWCVQQVALVPAESDLITRARTAPVTPDAALAALLAAVDAYRRRP